MSLFPDTCQCDSARKWSSASPTCFSLNMSWSTIFIWLHHYFSSSNSAKAPNNIFHRRFIKCREYPWRQTSAFWSKTRRGLSPSGLLANLIFFVNLASGEHECGSWEEMASSFLIYQYLPAVTLILNISFILICLIWSSSLILLTYQSIPLYNKLVIPHRDIIYIWTMHVPAYTLSPHSQYHYEHRPMKAPFGTLLTPSPNFPCSRW